MQNSCKRLITHSLQAPGHGCISAGPRGIYLTNRLINRNFTVRIATMKKMALVNLALLVLLSMTALAATGRYDQQIQQAVSAKVHDSKQLQGVQSSVEDGIVTLSGTVNLFQDKLDAAKKVKKLANVTGVRNQITVAGENVSDAQLPPKTSTKIAHQPAG